VVARFNFQGRHGDLPPTIHSLKMTIVKGFSGVLVDFIRYECPVEILLIFIDKSVSFVVYGLRSAYIVG
jgi:hypothetical protein